MRKIWSTKTIREAEAAAVAQAPEDALMKQAAAGVAEAASTILNTCPALPVESTSGDRPARVHAAALVGGGDNGGDALYAAAMLSREGFRTRAIIVSDHPHPRALAAATEAGVDIVSIWDSNALVQSMNAVKYADGAQVWLDGLLGTGTAGEVREPLRSTIVALEKQRLHDERVRVVTIDVHSGAARDDGEISGPALGGNIVVTMGAVKPSLVFPPARYLHDSVRIVELGLQLTGKPAARTMTVVDFARAYHIPDAHDHKYTRGVVHLMTGSEQYPGAAVLGAVAATSTGVGMVRFDSTPTPTELVLQRCPSVVTGGGRAQAIVVGSGMDPEIYDTRTRVEKAFKASRRGRIPLVVDAGALIFVAEEVRKHGRFSHPVVLTPHAGEAASLASTLTEEDITREDVQTRPLYYANLITAETGAITVLKGHATIITAPQAIPFVQAEAPAWAATAGTGDVLAGIMGARLAHNRALEERKLPFVDYPQVVAGSVWLHGTAAWAATGEPLRFPDSALRPQQLSGIGRPVSALGIAQSVRDVIGRALQACYRPAIPHNWDVHDGRAITRIEEHDD
ncbi:MAG: bifunctional ADP-dependent NAD(P)H-hydrate dehydratase/NAD(P)H-hydrate epimerase [Actinomycetaceae bacterium]|nr:bifunctional ADP-dependent NAD(P)H-hydrate dehydratase/NAD(P)H-hydrate epimerase [Actinomycetaceae bacterium]